MKYMRFYEDLFMDGDIFLTHHRRTKDFVFKDYTIKTHRGYYLDRINLFRFRNKPIVHIRISYYDDNLNYRCRETYIPYENYKSEMMAFYDAIVNG